MLRWLPENVSTYGGDIDSVFSLIYYIFFGHPEVYVIMLPGMRAALEVLPVFARKPIFGYRLIVGSTLAAGTLSFIVWAHQKIYLRRTGTTHWMAQMRIGGLEHQKVLRSMELFAREVMPALREEEAKVTTA